MLAAAAIGPMELLLHVLLASSNYSRPFGRGVYLTTFRPSIIQYYMVAQKVSHYQSSSLYHTKNGQRGYTFHQLRM